MISVRTRSTAKLSPADIDQMFAVRVAAFPGARGSKEFYQNFVRRFDHAVLVSDRGVIRGTMLYSMLPITHHGKKVLALTVENLAVHPELRGRRVSARAFGALAMHGTALYPGRRAYLVGPLSPMGWWVVQSVASECEFIGQADGTPFLQSLARRVLPRVSLGRWQEETQSFASIPPSESDAERLLAAEPERMRVYVTASPQWRSGQLCGWVMRVDARKALVGGVQTLTRRSR